MAAEEGVLAEFLDLLTPENRQWFESRPEAEQREVATRHLEAVQGDKEHALGAYDTHDTDVSGVAVGGSPGSRARRQRDGPAGARAQAVTG
ncbi:hypothetical protein SRIMM317S_01225 [Streptomyces rimosus subsp. rimosus]